jgi:ferritin-like metal-binding protein YciE
MESVREFFVHELGDMLDAERKILDILQQQQEEASNPQLQKAFEQHHAQTEKQIQRLEQVFQELDQEVQESECKGIQGLVEEKQAFMQEDPSEELIEIFTIGATAKVEHYEIAAYNSLIDLATKLGINKAVRLLNQNLKEEQQMLKKAEGFAKKFKPQNLGMEEGEEGEEEESTSRSRSRSRRAA